MGAWRAGADRVTALPLALATQRLPDVLAGVHMVAFHLPVCAGRGSLCGRYRAPCALSSCERARRGLHLQRSAVGDAGPRWTPQA